MNVDHHYALTVEWTGNRGTGTSGYRDYGRDHIVRAEGNPPIEGSSDRVFFGDAERWNPEELLVAALAQCHMLSYLHVAQRNGIVVTAYTDEATGTMATTSDGGACWAAWPSGAAAFSLLSPQAAKREAASSRER